eukprot:gnl/TRDRNA2_/TRDRNA2_195033_c0_seq1.p1 gnl/TRDRNA2_/TRDRNA2_195033_c0~~gnl/TRDRNA2_/TRDRNA2_195033_c0_seq1.p1  ORF type:complete len:336 (+),score=86.85 gnl/TRDRNA2_/TRDRNA2_195033_c0_seq1:138-1145(+)
MTLPSSWPMPAPLEGVKSRKRAIFELLPVETEAKEGEAIPGVTLTLGSRLMAVGEAAYTLKMLLLGAKDAADGLVKRHTGLNVLELRPSTDGAHEAAVAEAFHRERPHVVLIEEARKEGDAAWAQTFDELLKGEALAAFRGAVVICAEQVTDAISSVCPECWQAPGLAALLWPDRKPQEPFFIEDAVAAAVSSHEAATLLEEALELGKLEFADEDVLSKAEEHGWTVTLLADSSGLNGFLCHKHECTTLTVTRLAVPEGRRGRGYGKRLMRWLLDRAARMPRSECAWISLSSLKGSTAFYEQFGFTDMTAEDPDDDANTQTWMELRNEPVGSKPA